MKRKLLLIAGWLVHLFTSLGAVAGVAALMAASHGEWIPAFLCLGIACFIDAADGALARLCKVKETIPHFDGALLDNIIDYLTYVIVPVYIAYEANLFPDNWALITLAAMTISSCYQFCQSDAKTEDHYFKGFPSYWNIAIMYLVLLRFPACTNLLIIWMLVITVFIPVKYIYPSRTIILRKTTIALGILWAYLCIKALAKFPRYHEPYTYLSLIFVVYYYGLSLALTFNPAFLRRKQVQDC